MMSSAVIRFGVGLGLAMTLVLCLVSESDATYRKPPFNGSIFGKRGTAEYDPTGRALTALCEIANEACQAWFPGQDNK